MRVLEAKDFLVQQTAEQAALENVSLSDLEKRMMYFTESGEMSEDPTALNEAFEAEYDTNEYESKIGKLMRHAFWRLKKENPQSAAQWKKAIKELSAEDHYLSVLWDAGSSERPPYDSLKLLGAGVLVAVVGLVAMVGAMYISDRYGFHWPGGHAPTTHRSTPVWLQRTILWLTITGYIYYVVLPWLTKRPAIGFGELFGRLLSRLLRRRSLS